MTNEEEKLKIRLTEKFNYFPFRTNFIRFCLGNCAVVLEFKLDLTPLMVTIFKRIIENAYT